jgi:hypothetical protein
MRGRLVNASGYLIDKKGNIVNFTEFDINWIKGSLDRDITKNPRHDDEYDLDGKMINSLGYLVDVKGNIIDQYGKLVFRKDILNNAYGQDARIPVVFTKGLLLKPASEDSDDDETPLGRIIGGKPMNDYKSQKTFGNQSNLVGSGGPNDETGVRSSDGAPEAFSMSNGQLSGVFSMDDTQKQGQSSI